jgi:hypothetical protein
MAEIVEAPTTLRDSLETSFDALESGTLGTPQDAPEIKTEDRIRDEQGKFAKKPEESPETPKPEVEEVAPPPRPTTWKKEYLPLWDKLHQGLPLTAEESKKVAEYSGLQREREFANGVSTYKAEAQNAKQLQDAIAPFVPELQRNNVAPAQWITNLGNAHLTLVKGTPEQKIQMFARLAQEYGVPLGAIVPQTQGQLDPIVPQLMQQIQQLSGQVNTVTSWREQQEQMQLQNQLAPFQDTDKYPHFEAVRNDMALLLESGKAPNLDSAYKIAVRMNEDTWQAEQERQALAQSSQQAVTKAKRAAVSVKSSTPTGQVTTGAKDRRSILSDQLDAAMGGRV